MENATTKTQLHEYWISQPLWEEIVSQNKHKQNHVANAICLFLTFWYASIAQLVERALRKRTVVGSIPTVGSTPYNLYFNEGSKNIYNSNDYTSNNTNIIKGSELKKLIIKSIEDYELD